jgi:hypothetical protein
MMKNITFSLCQIFCVLFIFTRCSSDAVEEVVLSPSDLVYVINQIELVEGQKVNSVMPTIKGTKPFIFSLVSNPASNQITIDNQGVISVLENIAAGVYKVSVSVSNASQVVNFNEVFTINVKRRALPISNLVYAPNSAEANVGTSISSPTPTLQGTQPVTYSFAVSPTTDRISIDDKGVITASNTLNTGSYVVAVTARNEVGSVTFTNAFTFTIRAIISTPTAPTALSYSPNRINTEQGKTIASATPTITGTSPFTFSIASTNTGNGQISINANTGVITASPTTPVGMYNIDINVRNTAGNATFVNALSIQIDAPAPVPISFAKDVQPFLQVCGNCHAYNTYSSAKANIDNILGRVQRQVGSAGFMPQSGIPLTRAQIDILKKWVDDGLKE